MTRGFVCNSSERCNTSKPTRKLPFHQILLDRFFRKSGHKGDKDRTSGGKDENVGRVCRMSIRCIHLVNSVAQNQLEEKIP